MSHFLFFISLYSCIFLTKVLSVFQSKSDKRPNSILYLENFPVENAGYQYRAQKWAEILDKDGYEVEVWTLYPEKKDFDEKRKIKPFSRFLMKALWIRFFQVWNSRKFETIIVRRELLFFNDYGNLFLDKWLLKIHPNAILDIDDDLSASKGQPKKVTNWYGRLMGECGDKFNETIKMYKMHVVASNYLKERIITTNQEIDEKNIITIPTCVDYDKYHSKKYPSKLGKVTFGWIGGDHNYSQLRLIIPILNELCQEYDFKLIVIGGTEFKSKANFEVDFIPWSLESEVDNLINIDIGLMPLEETAESKGKGGFKLIQYMGLGIVSAASAVTINKEIIENLVNGFLLDSTNEWKQVLKNLLNGKYDLSKISYEARKTINSTFSFDANKNKYEDFIEYVRNCGDMES